MTQATPCPARSTCKDNTGRPPCQTGRLAPKAPFAYNRGAHGNTVCSDSPQTGREGRQTLFEFANALLAALFLAAVFDMVTALKQAPGRGFARAKAAVSGLWRKEHYLFGQWGAPWRQRAGEWLFAIGLAAYEVSVCFCNSMARENWAWVQGTLAPILDWTAFLCFGVKILLGTRYTWRSLGVAGCLYFIARWVYFNCHNIWWIGLVVAVLAAKGVALKKPLRAYLIAGTAAVGLVVALHFAGIVAPDLVSERVGEYRGTFGYGHPNTFGGLVFGLTMAYAMLRAKKVRWLDVAVVGALGVFLWVGPASRSAALSALLLAVLLTVYKVFPRLFGGRHLTKVAASLVPLVAAVSFLLPLPLVKIGPWNSDFGPAWLAKIDGLLTNRLSLTWSAYYLLDIKIAGQVLDDWPPLDNSFAFALYQFGPVMALIIGVLFAVAMWGLARTRRIPELLCLTVMLVYAYMECQSFHLTTNPTALLFCGAVFALAPSRWPGLEEAPPERE